jgi:hypothetical protein
LLVFFRFFFSGVSFSSKRFYSLGQRNEIVDQWTQISGGPPKFNSLDSISPSHPSYTDKGSSSERLCDNPIEDCFKKDLN